MAILTQVAAEMCEEIGGPIEPMDDEIARFVETTDLILARRPGQTAADFLRRLERLVLARRKPRGGGLASLPGMGEASTWAKRVVADLKACAMGDLDPAELDRGVILEGPPGCGKTSLARAIADDAGVPFVAASLQDWQGAKDGHLGTTLGAMRETFAEARASAPCVLLVDEIDSLGDRERFGANHRDYSRQVVNGFLEQLDGALGRHGILVVGCTNDASGLDPAITRSGRLERAVRVSLPDREAFPAIFRRHLGDALPGVDLAPLAEAAYARAASGADVERWCRSARGAARGERRPMVVEDLLAEVGEPPPPLTGEDLRLAAVHEAGHAVAYLACGPRVLIEVALEQRGGKLGYTRIDPAELDRGSHFVTRSNLRRKLRALLAGRAAEREILGEVSGGCGGADNSDLAEATRLATAAVATFGLGANENQVLWHRLRSVEDSDRLLAANPEIRVRVEALLAAAFADARRLIVLLKPAVIAIADALAERRHLFGVEVGAIVVCHRDTIGAAARGPGDHRAEEANP